MARHRHDHGSVDFQRSRVSAAAVFLLAGLAVGLAAGWGARVYAADGPLDSLAGATRTSASTEPAQEFSGRDFGGLRFPLSASKGRVSFSGSRVYTWARESPFSGTTVRAMLLSGDVQVKLGLYEFSAARAVVLLEKVAEPDEDEKPAGAPAPGTPAGSAGDAANQASAPKAPEPVHPTPPSGTPARPATEEAAGTYQFFVYFDRVASPAAAVGVSVQANRLAVRAVVDVEGSITLTSDVFFTGEPSDPLVPEAERALAAALRKQEGVEAASLPEPTLAQRPNSLAVPSESRSYLPATADQLSARAAADLAGQEKNLQDVAFTGPIFAKDGVFTVSPGDVTLVSGDDENALIVSRGFVLQYSDTRSGRSLQLTAQRGVVYTEPSPIKDIGKLRAGDIRGIYLEGDVIASDGQYTLRGPKMYYDVRRNKAVVLDGVFWTYDRQQRLPLYVRAEAIRQKSSNEFTARHAKLATSAFFEPDFSIGATTVTITRRQVNPTPQGIIPTVRSWASDGTGSSASRGAPGGSGAAGPGGFAFGGDASGFGRGYELESDYSKAATAALVPSMVTENFIDASNITLNAEGVPFFYWPFYEGPIDQGLLRDVRVEDKTASGVAIKTRWNAYRLIGLQGTPITRADLLLDAYFSRGPGVGTSLAWAGPDAHGNAFLYGLFGDHGTDVLPTGERVTYNDQTRGLITVDHTIHIDDHWTFFGELAYQSDANFVTAFYQDMAETRREFTTQGYLQRLEDNTAFNASMKGSMNNFITNEYLLQSQGYYVEKLPEFSYIRQADPLLSNWFGDALTWTQEYRYSYMSMDFDRVMPQNRGFSDPVQSMRIFGIQPDQTIYNNLTSQGYLPQNVNRIDTRQEVDAKFDWGPVNFVPFGVARLTGYDHNFENFAPGQTERVRVWGATGGTINTQFQSVDNWLVSLMLDLHRMRHIVEPSVTLFTAGTNRDSSTLPTYDQNVEAIAKGSAFRAGVNQIWQTQRGGPGNYHSVDVFTLDANYVDSTASTDVRSPVGRFFDYRPELSTFGKYGTLDSAWRVTEATTLTGGTVYDLNLNQQARTSAGIIVRQSPDVTATLDYRYLNALDLTTLGAGVSYRFSNLYSVNVSTSYDLTSDQFQAVGATFQRDFQSVRLGFNIAHSLIANQTTVGFTLSPRLQESAGRTPILGEAAPNR